MSERYSNSPVLHLQTGKSRIGEVLLTVLAFAACCALVSLLSAGHYALGTLLLLPALRRLQSLRVALGTPTCLGFRSGHWFVRLGDSDQPAQLERYAALPWILCLVLRVSPAGRRLRIWVFSDSADRETLRRLRVRLALSG